MLTENGRDLLPAALALMQWGDKHLHPDGVPLQVVDDATGEPVEVRVCNSAGDELRVDQLPVQAPKATRRRRNRRNRDAGH